MHSTAAHEQMNPRNVVWTKRKKEETTQKRVEESAIQMKDDSRKPRSMKTERKKERNQDKRKGKKAKSMREQGKESEKKGRQKLKRETEERKGNETKDETEKTQRT